MKGFTGRFHVGDEEQRVPHLGLEVRGSILDM